MLRFLRSSPGSAAIRTRDNAATQHRISDQRPPDSSVIDKDAGGTLFSASAFKIFHKTGKAVKPGARAGGPIAFEVDLTLVDLAGYNLLRLFGARAPATGVVAATT
jgi:hypothetical protein